MHPSSVGRAVLLYGKGPWIEAKGCNMEHKADCQITYAKTQGWSGTAGPICTCMPKIYPMSIMQIYCQYCDKMILDEKMFPGYKMPEIHVLGGRMICGECERLAGQWLWNAVHGKI